MPCYLDRTNLDLRHLMFLPNSSWYHSNLIRGENNPIIIGDKKRNIKNKSFQYTLEGMKSKDNGAYNVTSLETLVEIARSLVSNEFSIILVNYLLSLMHFSESI